MVPMHQTARRSLHGVLTESVEIVSATSGGSLDEATFAWTFDAESILWDGPAAIINRASSRTVGDHGAAVQVDEITVLVPIEAPAPDPGHLVRVVGSRDDDSLIGSTLEVLRSGGRSGQILRRLVCRRWEPHLTPSQ